MTPTSPPSPEGSDLPPRHRPNPGNFANDTSESDLWAFDEIDSDNELEKPAPKAEEPLIPEPRNPDKMKADRYKGSSASRGSANQDRIKMHVNKPRPRIQSGPLVGQSQSGSDFDDLDHWDEPAIRPGILEPISEIEAGPAAPEVSSEAEFSPAPAAAVQDELSPVVPEKAVPMSLRPKLGLSKVEWFGLVVLAVLLLGGGVVVYLNTISRLPTGSERVKTKDFPIQGKHLAVLSVDSYWRAPQEGDAVRRGTVLIPVVAITSSGGPAAIRVFFHNSDGESVGDAVTRQVQPGKSLQIAATGGFEDLGMHAAYRTGENKPWFIEVHEGPSENSPGAEFKKLLEMDISPDRR